MTTSKRPLRGYLTVLILFFMFVVTAAVMIYRQGRSRELLPVYGEVGPFEFVERSGEPFGSGQMKGKVNVVDFFFTNCAGPCPVMNAKMAELFRYYENTPAVQFVSISVDPDRDSLPALSAYAARFGATDDRWAFLRAPMDDVSQLAEKTFFLGGGEFPAFHSSKLILVDDQSRIRGYYSSEDSATVALLKSHIRKLLKDMP